MKHNLTQVIVYTILLLLLVSVIVIISISPIDNHTGFEKIVIKDPIDPMKLSEYFNGKRPEKLKDIFPYADYIAAGNWKSPAIIHNDLALMDSFNNNQFENMDILVKSLTIKNTVWNTNKADSLNLMLTWAESFDVASSIYSDKRIFFKSVYTYWMGQIAKRLKTISEEDGHFKYSFKFRYLRERCEQNHFSIGTRNTYFEKIIIYATEGKWHYIIVDRFWKATTPVFKIIIFGIIFLTCLVYYYMLKTVIKNLKK